MLVECGTVKHTKYKVRVIGMLVDCDLFRIQQLLWMIMHSCYIQWILSMQWFPFFLFLFFLEWGCQLRVIEVTFLSFYFRTLSNEEIDVYLTAIAEKDWGSFSLLYSVLFVFYCPDPKTMNVRTLEVPLMVPPWSSTIICDTPYRFKVQYWWKS